MEGFNVLIPFDSDEFLSTRNGESVLDTIASELDSATDTLVIPVVNYVQNNTTVDFSWGDLRTAQYVAPEIDVLGRHPMELVQEGLPFLVMPFPPKVLASTQNGVEFTSGSHGVYSLSGIPVENKISTNLVVRHLPLYSKNHTIAKQIDGKNLAKAGLPKGWGWQSQRLVDFAYEELVAYWNNNSWSKDDTGKAHMQGYYDITPDNSLVLIQNAIDALRFHAKHSTHLPDIQQATPRFSRLIEYLIDKLGHSEMALYKLQHPD